MSDLYAFRPGPSYRGASRAEMFDAAMSQPMSLTSTFIDQLGGGILESFGAGTVIKDLTVPEGIPSQQDQIQSTLRVGIGNPVISGYELLRQGAQSFLDQGKPLNEDAYKASPYFRDSIPWDAGMTDERAASLAMMDDAKKVREYYAEKRPFTAFWGGMAGQALDPINYVPVVGPAVKAAAALRFGKIAGGAITGAADAAANTALFGVLTAPKRATYGDDVSWQSTVSQIATAALIGAAFGTLGGAWEARGASKMRSTIEERLATLKTTQEARIALNEAIDGIARGDDVALSPNATEPLARVAGEVTQQAAAPPNRAPAVPEGFVRFYHGADEGGDPNAGGSRFATPDPEYARNFRAGEGQPKNVWYVDIAKGDPAEVAARAWDEADEAAGTNMVGVYQNVELPEETAGRMRRLPSTDRIVDQIEIGGQKQPIFEADTPPNSASAFPRAGGERVLFPIDGRLVEGTVFQNVSGGHTLVRTPDGRLFRSTWQAMGDAPAAAPTVDASAPRPEPIPEGRNEAETRIAKPDDFKAIAAQHGVDPEAGSFLEEADIKRIEAEGRLTEDDVATLAAAQSTFEDGAAYGEALKSVVGCLLL